MGLPYDDLLQKCEAVFTEQQAKHITRDQAHSKVWFRYRAGRVTASRFKAAANTNHLKPSQSLLKMICYPEGYKFSNVATRWDCEHEKCARDAYIENVADNHQNLTVCDKGLVIHPSFPLFSASPDGFVNCDCCGCGVIEIKCPYSCIGHSFLEASGDTSFCLEISDQGQFSLKRKHVHIFIRYIYR